MFVDGRGLIGRAFAEGLDPAIDVYVFARGVADSGCTDLDAFAREAALLEAALDNALGLGVPLVYLSGAPVYGRFRAPVDEDTPLRPISPYGAHKARMEDQIRRHGATHLIARLPNVVGAEANKRQLVPSLVDQARAGIVTLQSGAARDLIHVNDVVRCVDGLLRVGATDQTIIVASGWSIPIEAIADWICSYLGVAPRRELVSGGEAQQFLVGHLRSLVPSVSVFDSGYSRLAVARSVKPVNGAQQLDRLPASRPGAAGSAS